MLLPQENEINVFDSLDERCAVKNFLGKDLKQAEALFREGFVGLWGDLMWMGPKAFCFYVSAAIDYLRSPESVGDFYAVTSFCGLIEFRLEYDSAEIEAARAVIRDGILAILQNFDRYGDGCEIDGNLATRYRKLLTKLAR
jgi:hypothetical protein